jgi:hypothetical protein
LTTPVLKSLLIFGFPELSGDVQLNPQRIIGVGEAIVGHGDSFHGVKQTFFRDAQA